MGRSAQLGRRGEDAAAAHVTRLGWRILARNWRPEDRRVRGELDIVALDGHVLVICEVKTRAGLAAGEPLAGVTPRKLAQLRRLAGAWLAEHAGTYVAVRFDVVGLYWPSSAVAPAIDHARDIV